MKRRLSRFAVTILSAVTVIVGAVAATSPAHAIAVGGFNFASSADSLLASNGAFTTSGGSLATVLTDLDAGTFAFSFSPGASVTLGFSSGISNGSGADFVLFELGTPDTFVVTINSQTHSYLSANTGFSEGGFALNAAPIDLSDFGLSGGASVLSVFIDLSTVSGSGTVPSLSFAGVLNAGTSTAVPEPASLAVLGSALAGFGLLRRRKRA